MAESGKISGTAVAVATIGGLLAYAGFQGKSPVVVLRELSSGKLSPVSRAGSSLTTGMLDNARDMANDIGAAYADTASSHPFVAAALTFAKDQYSQTRRWQNGYSDCSSFAGKTLKKVGITPPGASVTGNYMTWSALNTIPKSQIRAGDILVSTGHMAFAINSTTGIGQQNSRDNVKIDSIKNLMWGQVWIARRFKNAPGGGQLSEYPG